MVAHPDERYKDPVSSFLPRLQPWCVFVWQFLEPEVQGQFLKVSADGVERC